MKTIRIATRQSKLALWQTEHVATLLKKFHPDLHIELVGITTEGDIVQHKSLADIGGKGLFVKALETALLENKADIAVHSMKDVPPELPDELCLGAILKRDDPRDTFISTHFKNLALLPQGAVVGTCSVRRTAQILAVRPDIDVKLLRGNVDTRLAKLKQGHYDAIILAAAGLHRLGLQHEITEYFTFDVMLPSVAQGAIGIELRTKDSTTQELIQALNDDITSTCIFAERSFIQQLHGNCHSPIGTLATIRNNQLHLSGLVAKADGSKILRDEISGDIAHSKMLGKQLAEKLISLGAEDILKG
jgi:hydroxymethylbilane synthase